VSSIAVCCPSPSCAQVVRLLSTDEAALVALLGLPRPRPAQTSAPLVGGEGEAAADEAAEEAKEEEEEEGEGLAWGVVAVGRGEEGAWILRPQPPPRAAQQLSADAVSGAAARARAGLTALSDLAARAAAAVASWPSQHAVVAQATAHTEGGVRAREEAGDGGTRARALVAALLVLLRWRPEADAACWQAARCQVRRVAGGTRAARSRQGPARRPRAACRPSLLHNFFSPLFHNFFSPPPFNRRCQPGCWREWRGCRAGQPWSWPRGGRASWWRRSRRRARVPRTR
jgi:hypothetical protein